ncbi:MAG: hypothetical protein K8S27_01655 [Candidatus Omnitrophica bacterium]|nr:hypothetical protein [Candidatus Omnitrophota bacterium]
MIKQNAIIVLLTSVFIAVLILNVGARRGFYGYDYTKSISDDPKIMKGIKKESETLRRHLFSGGYHCDDYQGRLDAYSGGRLLFGQ